MEEEEGSGVRDDSAQHLTDCLERHFVWLLSIRITSFNWSLSV